MIIWAWRTKLKHLSPKILNQRQYYFTWGITEISVTTKTWNKISWLFSKEVTWFWEKDSGLTCFINWKLQIRRFLPDVYSSLEQINRALRFDKYHLNCQMWGFPPLTPIVREYQKLKAEITAYVHSITLGFSHPLALRHKWE